jgi:hypothetical protein
MIVAILVHVAVSTAIGIALSLNTGSLNGWIAVVSLTIGLVAACFYYQLQRRQKNPFWWSELKSWELKTFYILIGWLCFRHFQYLFYYSNHFWQTLNPHNIGDLPLHIHYIKSFAGGTEFWPINPIFPSQPLHYPFGLDFYNAMLEVIGIPLQAHLFWVALALSVATLVLVHRWIGAFGVAALFLSGGIAGWQVLIKGELADYQSALAWKNIFLTLFVPQRGFLMAFPVGAYLLRQTYLTALKKKQLDGIEKLAAGLLWGLLPIFHAHSFVAVSLLIGGVTLYSKSYKTWLIPLVIAVLLAVPWLVIITAGGERVSAIQLQASLWMSAESEKNLLVFLFQNYGLWIVFPFALAYWGWRTKEGKPYRAIILSGSILLVVFQFLIMAPWQWDNIKLLVWPYLVIAGLIGVWISSFKRPSLRWLIVFTCFFSGAVYVVSSISLPFTGQKVYKAEALTSIESVMRRVPTDAVFAAAPIHNHPIGYFGKKLILGYPGHLWSHGIQYKKTEEKLDRLMQGESDWRGIAKELGINYIFWGPDEKRKYTGSKKSWQRELDNVSGVKGYEIYEIQ